MIVCIEGIDASGKAAQAARLAQRLDCGVLSFPDYRTISGRLIGDHLQGRWYAGYRDKADAMLDAAALQALMLTNRMEKAQMLCDARRDDRDVVLDRYWPSGYAYGGADGLDETWLIDIHRHLPQAHDYVLLDVPAAVSYERRPQRRDRYELQPGLMAEVAARYHTLWGMMHESHGSRWHVIDGIGPLESVHQRIWDAIAWNP